MSSPPRNDAISYSMPRRTASTRDVATLATPHSSFLSRSKHLPRTSLLYKPALSSFSVARPQFSYAHFHSTESHLLLCCFCSKSAPSGLSETALSPLRIDQKSRTHSGFSMDDGCTRSVFHPSESLHRSLPLKLRAKAFPSQTRAALRVAVPLRSRT